MAWNNYNPYGYAPPQTFLPQQNVQQMQPTQPQMLRCVPVTSRAEVDAFQIPFDGSTTYFADTSNGKIYTKTFNFNNGTAPVVAYIRESDVPAPQYATLDDLNALRMERLNRKVVNNDSDE